MPTKDSRFCARFFTNLTKPAVRTRRNTPPGQKRYAPFAGICPLGSPKGGAKCRTTGKHPVGRNQCVPPRMTAGPSINRCRGRCPHRPFPRATQGCHCETSAHTGCGNLCRGFFRRCGERFPSQCAHWLGMTTFYHSPYRRHNLMPPCGGYKNPSRCTPLKRTTPGLCVGGDRGCI